MRRLVVLALLLVAPVARAAPEASPELAALVPAETLLLAECNDLDGQGRFGEGTAIGKLLAEPEVKQFTAKLRASFQAAFAANSRGPLAMFGLMPEDFDGIVVRRAGLAIVQAKPQALHVDAVLYLETRAGGEKVARILKAIRQAAETFAGIPFKESDVRGRKVITTGLLGHEFCLAAQGDRFVFTTSAARMEDVLKAIDEGRGDALREAPRVAKLRERMGAQRNALFAYVDAAAIGNIVLDTWAKAGDAAEARRVLAALGLDAVEALGFADVPEGTGYRTEGAVLLKERKGLFALVGGAPPSHRFAKMTPGDALCYGGGTRDLAALWGGVLDLVGALDGKARGELEQGERGLGGTLGVDLRKDLLEAFGTEWAGYVAWPPGGGLMPDFVLFASIRDRERLVKALDTLASKAEQAVRGGASVAARKTVFRGTEIRFLEVTDRRGEPRPYAPAWAFGEDFVVMGLWPQSVKHALMERTRGGAQGGSFTVDESLAGRADFQQLLASAPRGAVSAGYVDLGRVFSWLYASGVPLLQSVQGAIHRPNPSLPAPVRMALGGLRFNFEDLPTADVIARHLSGILVYTAAENDCVRVGFVSQIGAPLAVVPVAALAAAAAFVIGTRQQHQRVAMMEARRAEEAARKAAAQAEQANRETETRRQLEAALAANEELAASARKLAEENALLRERLTKLEQRVEEILRAGEGKK